MRTIVKTGLAVFSVTMVLVGCNQPDGPIEGTNYKLVDDTCYVVKDSKLVPINCPNAESDTATSAKLDAPAIVPIIVAQSENQIWLADTNAELRMAHPSLNLGDVDFDQNTAQLNGFAADTARRDSLFNKGLDIVRGRDQGAALLLADNVTVNADALGLTALDPTRAAELAGSAGAQFSARGLDWLNINTDSADKGIIAITGNAATPEAQATGFAAAKATIQGLLGGQNVLVLDAVSSAGDGGAALGASFLQLVNSEKTQASCQVALDSAMNGRNISFQTGKADISVVSAQLLDAATGIILLCETFGLEVRGHTDARGGADANQRLSEVRANAVRSYIIDRGGKADKLTAIGMGESDPLINEDNQAAWTANRRTEFVVLAD